MAQISKVKTKTKDKNLISMEENVNYKDMITKYVAWNKSGGK